MSDMSSVKRGVSHKSSKPPVSRTLGMLQSSEAERMVEGGGGAGKRKVEDKLSSRLFDTASFCLLQRVSPQKSWGFSLKSVSALFSVPIHRGSKSSAQKMSSRLRSRPSSKGALSSGRDQAGRICEWLKGRSSNSIAIHPGLCCVLTLAGLWTTGGKVIAPCCNRNRERGGVENVSAHQAAGVSTCTSISFCKAAIRTIQSTNENWKNRVLFLGCPPPSSECMLEGGILGGLVFNLYSGYSSTSNVAFHNLNHPPSIQLLECAIPPPPLSVSQKIRRAISRKRKELPEICWCPDQIF